MSVALATTFHPRGEIPRLQRLLPVLKQLYSAIVISLPPNTEPLDVEAVMALPDVTAFVNDEWGAGRYRALEAACQTGADFIHYADMDRLIRWAETRETEWLQTVEYLQTCDCLIIGRTPEAWETHPQVMIQMEHIINSVFSFHLNGDYDFGAGSKGFSRRAAAYILDNCEPANAIGADTEWPIVCYRAGMNVEGVLVDGLDWEIPDQFQPHAADRERQHVLAAEYDADVQRWQHRMKTTREAVEAGLVALKRPLKQEQT